MGRIAMEVDEADFVRISVRLTRTVHAQLKREAARRQLREAAYIPIGTVICDLAEQALPGIVDEDAMTNRPPANQPPPTNHKKTGKRK
jgi:hypothetical protein